MIYNISPMANLVAVAKQNGRLRNEWERIHRIILFQMPFINNASRNIPSILALSVPLFVEKTFDYLYLKHVGTVQGWNTGSPHLMILIGTSSSVFFLLGTRTLSMFGLPLLLPPDSQAPVCQAWPTSALLVHHTIPCACLVYIPDSTCCLLLAAVLQSSCSCHRGWAKIRCA